jgi:hypothetical protein
VSVLVGAGDVEHAAAAVRSGRPLGRVNAQVEKARATVEATKRDAAVRARAVELAEAEVAQAITGNAPAWLDAIDAEAEHARDDARAALAALEDAIGRINAASSTRNWLVNATADNRYDRPPKPVTSYALSSQRMTANSVPLSTPELVGYLHELLEPEPAATAAAVETPTFTV